MKVLFSLLLILEPPMVRLVLFFLLLLCHTTFAFPQGENLKIAVASNLLAPLEQVKALYEEEFQSTITLIVASSGKLTAQIVNGAPYDLFISADMKYPEKVYAADLAQQKPEILQKSEKKRQINQKEKNPPPGTKSIMLQALTHQIIQCFWTHFG